MDLPMRSLPVATYAAAIRTDAGRLADAAGVAGPGAAVPTCPEWNVRDLVRHLGGVHRWATGYVAGRRTEVWDVDIDEVVGHWPADHELADWFLAGAGTLAAAIEAADPDLQCWTFLRAASPLLMWARRQAHETAIHRVDGEAATGAPAARFEPSFAADGIDELLTCFVTRPKTRLRADPPRSLRVRTTDADGDWTVAIGPDGVTTGPGAAGADATASGEASDLYQALWNRQGTDALDVAGDPAVLALFLDRVHVSWS